MELFCLFTELIKVASERSPIVSQFAIRTYLTNRQAVHVYPFTENLKMQKHTYYGKTRNIYNTRCARYLMDEADFCSHSVPLTVSTKV